MEVAVGWYDKSGHTTLPSDAAKQEIGRRIAEAREKIGLRAVDLAQAMGRNASGISDVERGVASVSLGAVLQYAEALGVAPGSLLPGATANGSNEHYQRGFRHGYLHAMDVLKEQVPE